jgi:mannose-6-phosphate isomerase-like protein (cupin superfamily)
MKTYYHLILFVFFGAFFASCSTDVELYTDYKDVAIIYGLLNYQSDTNYIKITRAFCGTNDDPINAHEVALIADSSNYPGKLETRLVELKSTIGSQYEPTGREFVLDTMTIHDKEEGTFYSPDQKVYYTTEQLNASTNGSRYKYRLKVVKPDGDTVTAQTTMVGDEEFRILSGSANFQLGHTNAMGKIVFRADGMASLYDVKVRFNYSEQHVGEEMKWKHVSRSFGTKTIDKYLLEEGTENTYYLQYSLNWLFNALESAIGSDTVVDGNHPNVVRHIGGFVISISAGGDDMSMYYSANQAQLNSPMSLVSLYTNIDGGYGLFSSRTTVEKTVKLTLFATRDLYSVTAWGFKEQ